MQPIRRLAPLAQHALCRLEVGGRDHKVGVRRSRASGERVRHFHELIDCRNQSCRFVRHWCPDGVASSLMALAAQGQNMTSLPHGPIEPGRSRSRWAPFGRLRRWGGAGFVAGLSFGLLFIVSEPPPETTMAVSSWAGLIYLVFLVVMVAVPLGLMLLLFSRTRRQGLGILLSTGIMVGTCWLTIVLLMAPEPRSRLIGAGIREADMAESRTGVEKEVIHARG